MADSYHQAPSHSAWRGGGEGEGTAVGWRDAQATRKGLGHQAVAKGIGV
ncbi:MAG: hypothetical protein IKZ10_02335 [Akkermansia sp.]|nr:hypothetical protein [Akkermansia sp.]